MSGNQSSVTGAIGEEIRVLETTLALGNKLQKLKADEATLKKHIKGLEDKLTSARNIDLDSCQKKLASLQEVADTFGDDDDDAEVVEVTKMLIPKYIKYISLKKAVPEMQAKRQELLDQLKIVSAELVLAEKVDLQATMRWLEAHRALLVTYQEPTPKNVDVSAVSKKRALQAALAAENRRVKCAQGRIKSLRMSLDALAGAETMGVSFLVRRGADSNNNGNNNNNGGGGDGDEGTEDEDEGEFEGDGDYDGGGDDDSRSRRSSSQMGNNVEDSDDQGDGGGRSPGASGRPRTPAGGWRP